MYRFEIKPARTILSISAKELNACVITRSVQGQDKTACHRTEKVQIDDETRIVPAHF